MISFNEYKKFQDDVQILTDNVNRMMLCENIEDVNHYLLCAIERLKIIGNDKLNSLTKFQIKYGGK